MTTSPDDGVHKIGEAQFLLVSRFVTLYAVGAFNDEYVGSYWREFRLDKMSVFFSGVVAGVQYSKAGHVDEEHAGAQDVAGVVGGEGDSGAWGDELVGGYGDDGSERHGDIQGGEEGV